MNGESEVALKVLGACCRPQVVQQARSAIDVLADGSVPRPVRQVAGAECIEAVIALMGLTAAEGRDQMQGRGVVESWAVPDSR